MEDENYTPVLSRSADNNNPSASKIGGGFVDWWDQLGEDKKAALGMGALTAGLSMMAQGPSRYPISPIESFGKAGLAGLQTYSSAMESSRKANMEDKELAFREATGARDQARLDLDRQKFNTESSLAERKQAHEESLWKPGRQATYEEIITGYRPVLGEPVAPDFNIEGIKSPLLRNKPEGQTYGLEMSEPESPLMRKSPGKADAAPFYLGEPVRERRLIVPEEPGGPKWEESQLSRKEKETNIEKIEAETEKTRAGIGTADFPKTLDEVLARKVDKGEVTLEAAMHLKSRLTNSDQATALQKNAEYIAQKLNIPVSEAIERLMDRKTVSDEDLWFQVYNNAYRSSFEDSHDSKMAEAEKAANDAIELRKKIFGSNRPGTSGTQAAPANTSRRYSGDAIKDVMGAPPGAVPVGKTKDGRPAYKLQNGTYWTP